MAHVRQQIRAALKTQLAGLDTTGGNVFENRVHNVPRDTLPALLISVESEDAERLSQAGDLLRTASIVVEARAEGGDTLDDTLDTICAEVEAAIAADRTLGGLAKDTQPTGTDIPPFDGDVSPRSGMARMTFAVAYVTAAGDAETAK